MVISPDNKAFSKGTAFLRTDTVPEFFNRWLGFGCSFLFVIPTFFAMYNLWKKEQNRRSSVVMLEKEASQFFPTVKLCDLLDNKKQGSSTFQESKTKQLDYGATTSSKTNMEICDDVESPAQATCQATGNQKKETATDASSDDCDNDKKLEELQTKFRESQKPLSDGKIAPAALAACVFALGLAISEMVLPSKVLGFLALYTLTDGSYDPTLITVMVGGSVISFLSYQFVEGWGIIKNPWARHCPFTASEFCVPTNKTIDWKLIFGAFCFGVGWATAGLCPGPATFLAASGTKPVLAFWWPFYYIGAFAAKKLQAYTS